MIFWENVKLLIKNKNLTQEKLCNNCNISLKTFVSWIHNERLPDVEQATRIAHELGTTVEYLVSGKDTPAKSNFYVPFLRQKLSAGKGTEIVSTEQPESWIQVSEKLKRFEGHLAAMQVKGDSMEPTIHDGDIVVCDNLGYDNEEGIYVVYLNGTGLIKRIQIGARQIYIISDNPKYRTIEEPSDSDNAQIAGKVRAIIHVL